MKKILLFVLLFSLLVLSLTACGNDPRGKDTTQKETDLSFIATRSTDKFEVTREYTAEGDEIIRLTQTLSLDLNDTSDEIAEILRQSTNQVKSVYEGISGVKYETSEENNQFKEIMTFDLREADPKDIVAFDLIDLTIVDNKVSVSETKEALQEAGWQIK